MKNKNWNEKNKFHLKKKNKNLQNIRNQFQNSKKNKRVK